MRLCVLRRLCLIYLFYASSRAPSPYSVKVLSGFSLSTTAQGCVVTQVFAAQPRARARLAWGAMSGEPGCAGNGRSAASHSRWREILEIQCPGIFTIYNSLSMGPFRIFAWRPLSSCHWSLTSCSHRVDPTVVLPRILGSPASPVHEFSPNVSALRGRGSLRIVYSLYKLDFSG